MFPLLFPTTIYKNKNYYKITLDNVYNFRYFDSN